MYAWWRRPNWVSQISGQVLSPQPQVGHFELGSKAVLRLDARLPKRHSAAKLEATGDILHYKTESPDSNRNPSIRPATRSRAIYSRGRVVDSDLTAKVERKTARVEYFNIKVLKSADQTGQI